MRRRATTSARRRRRITSCRTRRSSARVRARARVGRPRARERSRRRGSRDRPRRGARQRGFRSSSGIWRRRRRANVLPSRVSHGPGHGRGRVAPIRGASRSQPVHAVPSRARRAAGPRAAHLARRSRGAVFPRHPLCPILRGNCRADVCLYNSGSIRGNASYGSEPLTYGDLVAEVLREHHHPGDDRGWVRGDRVRGGAD